MLVTEPFYVAGTFYNNDLKEQRIKQEIEELNKKRQNDVQDNLAINADGNGSDGAHENEHHEGGEDGKIPLALG